MSPLSAEALAFEWERRAVRRAGSVAGMSLGLAFCLGPSGAGAQDVGLSGYYLNVATRAGSVLGQGDGFSDFQRLRLMWSGGPSPFHVDLAYEHTLTARQAGAQGAQLFTAAGVVGGGDWLDLGGELERTERAQWRHRLDQLALQVDLGESADLVMGRQTISWATTLVMTPGDPFSPFDPADPFREYRRGVDAVRIRYYRGPFTQLEAVVRPATFGGATKVTALARAVTNRGGWDVSAWAGSLHGQAAAALSASGGLGLWALRVEAVAQDAGEDAVFRGTVGLDRTFGLAGRDAVLVFEYQRDGLAAASADGYGALLTSPALGRGELQVLGRHELVSQASLQLHPLLGADLLGLVNLVDGSVLLGPGVGYSASHSLSLRLGAFYGLGDGAAVTPGGQVELGSEYGATPLVVFLSLSAFF
ncbi:MAG: hypothetical protein HKO53_01780 [Gemmatimonadetes bacterium]|nr:hypothetical protein [Gemmatimonadota bacterium]